MLAEYIYLGDQLLSMTKPGELAYYFHNDHLGTQQVLTSESQTVAWKAIYTPFGEAVVSIATVENPFRFPGHYYDSETGLHYNYYRYYNPLIGRYLTPDPIGLEGGINLFVYVAGNPVNFTDPLGLLDIYGRAGASPGEWVYEVEFYQNPELTLEREIRRTRTSIRWLDIILKIVDYTWGKRTGVSDVKGFLNRVKCDKADRVAKEIKDKMFPNTFTLTEQEFRKFMDAFFEAMPEMREFYNVDQMIQRAKQRGRRLNR
jgi:RHS repeat-associated protein